VIDQNELQAMSKGLPRHILKLALAELEQPFGIDFQDRNDDQGLDMLSKYGQDGLPLLVFAVAAIILVCLAFDYGFFLAV
jgi:hypothetical protein